MVLTLKLSLAACANNTPTTPSASTEQVNPKIGVTIYKFDDNFMSFVRRTIEKGMEGKVNNRTVVSTFPLINKDALHASLFIKIV